MEFYLPRWGRPHAPVKADSSMLNLGSPRPPLLTVPEGFEVCWRMACAETNWSMSVRRESSSPVVNWSMIPLKTRDESRVQV